MHLMFTFIAPGTPPRQNPLPPVFQGEHIMHHMITTVPS